MDGSVCWIVCFVVLLGNCGLWNGGFRSMVDEAQCAFPGFPVVLALGI